MLSTTSEITLYKSNPFHLGLTKSFFIHLQQADNFCNGIGILQQASAPTKFLPERTNNSNPPPPNPPPDNQSNLLHFNLVYYIVFEKHLELWATLIDYSLLFATLIARTAKDIDHLIESLPSEESSTELQVWRAKPSTKDFFLTWEMIPDVISFIIVACQPTETWTGKFGGDS